jgi:hypothetical protein
MLSANRNAKKDIASSMKNKSLSSRRGFLELSIGAAAGLLSNVFQPTKIVLAESSCAPAVTTNDNRGCSLEYEYPLYPWARNWSQIFVYEWQNYQSVDKILADIRIVDTVTRGIAKVVVLPGLQKAEPGYAPWDSHWPSFSPLRDGLARPGVNETSDEAVRWLMTEARKHNTQVTFHLDLNGVCDHDLLFQLYKDNGLVIFGDDFADFPAAINRKREFELGFFQKRIDAIVERFPELKQTKLVKTDWNIAYTGKNYSLQDHVNAEKKCLEYLKKKHGIEVITELVQSHHPENLYGMRPMAMSFWRNSTIEKMDAPAYVFCGGGSQGGSWEAGKCSFSLQELLFGATIQVEGRLPGAEKDYCDSPGGEYKLCRDFCYSILAWYYLNRLLRVSYKENDEVQFSNGVRSFVENGSVSITRDSEYIRQGGDLFIPALWRNNREIMAWSETGYSNRKWKLPPEWHGVDKVDVYWNKMTGTKIKERDVATDEKGYLTLSMDPYTGVIVVPAGADTNDKGALLPPSGKVKFLGVDDTTKGSWLGAYGKDGHIVFGDESLIPQYASVSFINGKTAVWRASTREERALQKPSNPKERLIARREHSLHEIIDVRIAEGPRKVALYFCDFDRQNRQMAVDVLGADTTDVLDSQILNNFPDGKHLLYEIDGHVQFRLTKFFYDHYWNPGTPVISGIFFGEG